MRLTRPGTLLALAAAAALVGFLGVRLWDTEYAELPGVPRSAPVAIAIAAVIVVSLALSLRARLRAQRDFVRALQAADRAQREGGDELHPPARVEPGRPQRPVPPVRPVNPFLAARAVAMAKACAHVGAVVGGFYAGFALYLLPDVEAPLRRERAIVCALSVAASAALVGAALWLERVLRLPDDRDQPPGAWTA